MGEDPDSAGNKVRRRLARSTLYSWTFNSLITNNPPQEGVLAGQGLPPLVMCGVLCFRSFGFPALFPVLWISWECMCRAAICCCLAQGQCIETLMLSMLGCCRKLCWI